MGCYQGIGFLVTLTVFRIISVGRAYNPRLLDPSASHDETVPIQHLQAIEHGANRTR